MKDLQQDHGTISNQRPLFGGWSHQLNGLHISMENLSCTGLKKAIG